MNILFKCSGCLHPISALILCVLPGGGCEIPVPLQGTEIGVISDAECTSQWGDSFQESNMICVWDGASGTVGACNVSEKGGPS